MIKPLHLMSLEEKAELMKKLRKDAGGEEFFTGALGNRNSFFIAKPPRRKKSASRRKTVS